MEKAFLFGEKKNLVGVLSEPYDGFVDDKPFVIILNAGLVHHPGPFRMNKEFSMLLAENGYGSLRFDLSGVGDSEKRAMDGMLNKDRNLSDVGEAIDFIKEKIKPSRIITMGLCTGADLAHRSAVEYLDVCGSILLDGYGYPTRKFYFKRYAPIFISSKRLFNLALKLMSKVIPASDKGSAQSESGADAYYWELPDKQKYVADMEGMFDKEKKHLYVYTSGVREYYNYEQQFIDAFNAYPFSASVQVKYFSYADHVYTLLEQRNNLFETMLTWLKKF